MRFSEPYHRIHYIIVVLYEREDMVELSHLLSSHYSQSLLGFTEFYFRSLKFFEFILKLCLRISITTYITLLKY